jgi:predicted lipid-binding transport protein (Tim44 family)
MYRFFLTYGHTAAFTLVAVATALEAEARVGGGQYHSSGGSRRSSSSGHSSGGGGGDGGALVEFLIWMLVRHPKIGVPVLVLTLVFVWFHQRSGSRRHIDVRFSDDVDVPMPRAAADPFASIRKADPAFSAVVLADFVQLVHRRAIAAMNQNQFEAVRPFVAPEAAGLLKQAYEAASDVDDVVLASIQFEEARTRGEHQQFRARLTGSAAVRHGGALKRIYFEESWTFRRRSDAVSLAPEAVRRMGCPACGAALETDALGTCQYCQAPIGDGRLQWQAVHVARIRTQPLGPPEYAPAPGGDEPSYRAPTRSDPRLASALRAFVGRHPDFDARAFDGFVRSVFLVLQAAWSDGQWSRARPFTTDLTYDTLRFWLERYATERLRNRLVDVQFERMQIVRVGTDAWYESITVRLWASAIDYVEDATGKVVGGNTSQRRRFSEYWTFLRTAGHGASVGSAAQCPSCGAALDRIDASGICGYCETRITSGDHGWVLSRIDQVEAYAP